MASRDPDQHPSSRPPRRPAARRRWTVWWNYPAPLREVLERWGLPDTVDAPYVVAGLVRLPGLGWRGGALAMARDQLSAHRIRRAFAEYGDVEVCRTEWHPDGAQFEVTVCRQVDALTRGE